MIPGNGSLFTDFGLEDGEWEYLDNVEEREEAGTPNILGSVRAAFAFIMKDNLSVNFIQHQSKRHLKYFMTQTKAYQNLVILGNTECERLPILSLMVTHSQKRFGYQKTKYLHHNFIAALLNDLFGIQGRGGSGNAGMYCLNVLSINNNEIEHILDQIRSNENEIARPGVFRINLHFTLNETELKYVVDAIKYICKNGWKFLPLYNIEKETGYYVYRAQNKHKENDKFSRIRPNITGSNKDWRSLLDVGFDDNDGKLVWNEKHIRVDSKSLNANFDKFFDLADDIIYNLDKYLPTKQQMIHDDEIHDDSAWYWLPSELYQDAANTINHNNNNNNIKKFAD